MCCVTAHQEPLWLPEYGASLTEPAQSSRVHYRAARASRRGPGGGCHSPRAPGALRERVGAPVPRQVPGAPCRARAPPGSNLRADRSMICAQAGAAKVSEPLVGTLPAAPSPALLWAASPPLPRPRQRPPSPGPGIHPPPHPLASPARFNCQRGTCRRPGRAGIPGGDPGSGMAGTPGPPAGHGEKQRSPQAGWWRLPRPPAPSQRRGGVRGGGGETYVIPLPSPHPPSANQGSEFGLCLGFPRRQLCPKQCRG